MGNLTTVAEELLLDGFGTLPANNRANMAGSVNMMEGGTMNRYGYDRVHYDPQSHLELALMSQMLERYHWNPAVVPDGSRIVFVCNWSPCRFCCQPQGRIDMFMNALGQGRNIQVKFRFYNWYIEDNHQGHGTWANILSAQQGYNAVMARYGNLSANRTPARDVPVPTLPDRHFPAYKVKRALVIQQMNGAPTSRIVVDRTDIV